MTEAKLQDQFNDLELDATASVVKQKSQFDAGMSIISFAKLIYVILKLVHPLDQSEVRN